MEYLTKITNVNPEIIIQGGLTVAVVGLIWLNAASNKRYFNHTSEVIDKNSKAFTNQAISHEKLSNSIDNLVKFLKKK